MAQTIGLERENLDQIEEGFKQILHIIEHLRNSADTEIILEKLQYFNSFAIFSPYFRNVPAILGSLLQNGSIGGPPSFAFTSTKLFNHLLVGTYGVFLYFTYYQIKATFTLVEEIKNCSEILQTEKKTLESINNDLKCLETKIKEMQEEIEKENFKKVYRLYVFIGPKLETIKDKIGMINIKIEGI